MAPLALEKEDKARDAAFNKALHGNSAKAKGGIAAMFSKGSDAKKAAVDEYFKHWDNKPAENETAEERAVSSFLFSPLYLSQFSLGKRGQLIELNHGL